MGKKGAFSRVLQAPNQYRKTEIDAKCGGARTGDAWDEVVADALPPKMLRLGLLGDGTWVVAIW
jgi:hypothetical protein